MQNIYWVIRNGLISLFQQRVELFKPLTILFVLFLAVTILDYVYVKNTLAMQFYELFNVLLEGLVLSFAAISVHRALLQSDLLHVEPDFLVNKTESNVRYLVRAFWIFIMTSVIFIGAFYFGFFAYELLAQGGISLVSVLLVGLAVGVGLFFYYFSPIFLILPCVAYQGVMSFDGAFKLGRNHRFLMFTVVIILPMLMQAIMVGLTILFKDNGNEVDVSLLGYFSQSTMYFISTIISITFLSAAYARIKSIKH